MEWDDAEYAAMMQSPEAQAVGRQLALEQYRQTLRDLISRQWKDDPETLSYLLGQLQED